MGKKRRILFAVLVVAVVGGLAWMVLRPDAVRAGTGLSGEAVERVAGIF